MTSRRPVTEGAVIRRKAVSAEDGDFLRSTVPRKLYRHRWWILGSATLVIFGLGLWGYTLWYARYGKALAWPERIYASFSLFRDTTTIYALGKTTPQLPIPPPLEVARFIAPLILVAAGLSALIALFSAQVNHLRIRRFYRRHVIICGLGLFGLRLAKEYDRDGQKVVVIDANPQLLALSQCRKRLIPVLVADATDPEALRHAGVRNARHVVAVCGDDGVDGQVGLTIEEMSDRADRLRCTMKIDDEAVCDMLEDSEFGQSRFEEGSSLRIHYINIFRSAPLILQGVLSDAFAEDGGAPHIIVAGTDPLGLRFVVSAAREWWFLHRDEQRRMRIALLAPDAHEHGKLLAARYPHFEEACDFECFSYDLTRPQKLAEPWRHDRDDAAHDLDAPDQEDLVRQLLRSDGWSSGTAFVTYADERDSLAATKVLANLAESLPSLGIKVVTTGSTGTITPLLDAMLRGERYRNVETLSLAEKVCRPSFFESDLTEEIARALHKKYVEGEVKAAKKAGRPPRKAARAWEQLDDENRESNRDQARGYGEILGSKGYVIDRTDDWGRETPQFDEPDVDDMARMEHERWCRFKGEWGWQYGEKTEEERRINNLLKPWADLDEGSKEWNRRYITDTPAMLLRYGIAVRRRLENSSEGASTRAGL